MWQEAFSQEPDQDAISIRDDSYGKRIDNIRALKSYLDMVHIKHCLLRPYFESEDYPVVEARELLPSFEIDLYEHKQLPGFSMVAFDREMKSFHEVFQYDVLHTRKDWESVSNELPDNCPIDHSFADSVQTFKSRLPRFKQEAFNKEFQGSDICNIRHYDELTKYLMELERAHVVCHDSEGEYSLAGVYGSLPHDLDTEIKRYGLKIKKFHPGNNHLYECNRLFVYQYLMELHGFTIVSERRTSAALFASRLLRMGEKFLVRVLGQSDRTITTLSSHDDESTRSREYLRVEKTALLQVSKDKAILCKQLSEGGFYVDPEKRTIILRVIYQQHDYNPKNVREDRALSIRRQEVIHPLTGEILSGMNVINDASSMVIILNDIVRGEYRGSIAYQRHEIITDTVTHENRLKFLSSWLTKHQRRIIGYSDEFYSKMVTVLDSYLLSPDNYETFDKVNDLHQEVWSRYSHIQQARKIKTLEDLRVRTYKGNQISYLEMLQLMGEILNELKFEIVNYFDRLVLNTLLIGDDVLNDKYLQRKYIQKKDDQLSDYGLKIKKSYGKIVALLDEFRSIRKSRKDETGNGFNSQHLL
ncbi:MAG: hypothetical protein ACNI27_08230 [Desulfovibrio sp.]